MCVIFASANTAAITYPERIVKQIPVLSFQNQLYFKLIHEIFDHVSHSYSQQHIFIFPLEGHSGVSTVALSIFRMLR